MLFRGVLRFTTMRLSWCRMVGSSYLPLVGLSVYGKHAPVDTLWYTLQDSMFMRA